jgi:hypothetical protein
MATPKNSDKKKTQKPKAGSKAPAPAADKKPAQPVPEMGGRGGLDPTRYGDWEIGGRCVDF